VTTTPLLTVVVVYAEDVNTVVVFALPWAAVDMLDAYGSDGAGVLLGVDDVEGDIGVEETDVGVVELGLKQAKRQS